MIVTCTVQGQVFLLPLLGFLIGKSDLTQPHGQAHCRTPASGPAEHQKGESERRGRLEKRELEEELASQKRATERAVQRADRLETLLARKTMALKHAGRFHSQALAELEESAKLIADLERGLLGTVDVFLQETAEAKQVITDLRADLSVSHEALGRSEELSQGKLNQIEEWRRLWPLV